MEKTPTQLTMERETRVALGSTPKQLADEPLAESSWQMCDDQFLLRGTGEHYFHYRRGRGITIARGPGTDESEESLWLNGTVYSAIASLNGLMPLHASAIAFEGSVYAFTGRAGDGKSTLVAALGALGFPMFSDDTLVLDLSDQTAIRCLPGHKRLKLTANAFDLTGALREEKVSSTVEKFYARPTAGVIRSVLPLAKLFLLEQGSECEITPISGGKRLLSMEENHYTTVLYARAQQFDRHAQFAHRARLARQMDVVSFARPFDPAGFAEGVARVAEYITGGRE